MPDFATKPQWLTVSRAKGHKALASGARRKEGLGYFGDSLGMANGKLLDGY